MFNLTRSRVWESRKFRHFKASLGLPLPPFPNGRLQFLWNKAVERNDELYRQVLRKRKCVVESGIHYSEHLPNAVCSLIAPNHYAIVCYSSVLAALTNIFAYIVNRRHLFFAPEIRIENIVVDPALEYAWGFEPFFSRQTPLAELHEVSDNGLFDYMIICALEFILHHEYGHIVLGHLDYYASTARKGLYAEVPDNDNAFDSERAYCEICADRHAVFQAIQATVFDESPKSLLVDSGITWDDAAYAIQFVCQILVLWMLSVSTICGMRAPFDPEYLKSWSSYPSIFYRLFDYRTIISTSHMLVPPGPGAELIIRSWKAAENILVKLASFNRWFSIICHALSPEHTDRASKVSLRNEAIDSFDWRLRS
jgi:hypothetical protein